jgi:membrane peptidoglycan carboxypeptidase
MATAYAGIGNNGVFCSNVAIDRISTTTGSSVAVPQSACKQAIPSTVAAALAWTLQHVIEDGTATAANPGDGIPILAKTGTTDNYGQNWLVTSSSKVANAIWVGQISGSENLQYYDYNGAALAYAKFYADQTILQALDATYGGSAFTNPPDALLYGSNTYSGPSVNGSSSGNDNGSGSQSGNGDDGNGNGSDDGGGNDDGSGGGTGGGTGESTSTPSPSATSTPAPTDGG